MFLLLLLMLPLPGLVLLMLLELLVLLLLLLNSPLSVVVVEAVHVLIVWPILPCTPGWEFERPPLTPWHNLSNLDKCLSKVL